MTRTSEIGCIYVNLGVQMRTGLLSSMKANMPMGTQTPGESDIVARQALRLQRFFMSVATYASCGVLAQICAWLGYLPSALPAQWLMGAMLVNGIFYGIFRSDLNLRLRDPSMTEIQLIASMFAVMALVYYADAARGAFLMLFPVPLLFGSLRLRQMEMLRVSAVGIVGFMVVIVVSSVRHPEQVQLGLEIVNLLALTGVMVFVALLSGYISRVRVELSKLLRKIEDMAQKDALTGVFNRRHLNETLVNELQRYERQARQGIVLCMVDIDHFKRVNDSFGHPVGDQVLVAVAQSLGQSIRSIDYLARYGGEEFLMLLDIPATQDWMIVCERARVGINKLQISAINNQRVSVSIGVAHCVTGDSVAAMMSRADQALYQAKQDGRNCIRPVSRAEFCEAA
jgi:diguanylate cyclase (GGDEF)-like protein